MLKSAQGKYRLNPAWEGGATSRRTSRRPQKTALNFTPPQPHPHFWPQGKAGPEDLMDVKPIIEGGPSHSQPGNSASQGPITTRVGLRLALGVLAGQLKELVAAKSRAIRST